MQISFELNFHQTVIQRQGYTLFDLLSGVGGIQSVLYAVFSLFLSYFNYNNFSSHLASKFYKTNIDEGDDNNNKHDPPPKHRRKKSYKRYELEKKEKLSSLVPTKSGNLKEFFIDNLPKTMVCCRKTRMQTRMAEARDALDRETNILEIIKV